MGNPLSPLLADLFLDNLEKNLIFNNTSQFKNIFHWSRYVDDILAFIDGSPSDAEDILQKINCLHPSISFTLEIEKNEELNFLDLKLKKLNNKINFSIFRKPTQTDHMIPATSNHPYQQKMSSLNCYIHRLLNIPMTVGDYNKEVLIIKQLAKINGYSPHIVDKIINKIKYKNRRNLAFSQQIDNTDNSEHIYRSLPYLGNISNNIARILTSQIPKLKISFKCKTNIKSLFSKTKDKTKKLEKSGIYRLACGDCPVAYVGRTTRSLEVRIKEHLSRPEKSAFGHHINFSKHNFSPTKNSKILHNIPVNNYRKMNLLEDLEILRELQKNPVNCVNTQVNLNCNFKPLFKYLWDSQMD